MYAGQKQLPCPISLYKVKPCRGSSSPYGLAEWLRKTEVKVTGNRKWCSSLTSQPLPLPCFPRVGTSPPQHLPLPLGWQFCHPVSGFLHASCPSCLHSTCSPNASLGLYPRCASLDSFAEPLSCPPPSHFICAPASLYSWPLFATFLVCSGSYPLVCSDWLLCSGISLPVCLPSLPGFHFRQGQLALYPRGGCLLVSYFPLAASCVHTQLYHALILWVCKFLDLSCFCACLYNMSGVGTPLANSLRRLSELLSA